MRMVLVVLASRGDGVCDDGRGWERCWQRMGMVLVVMEVGGDAVVVGVDDGFWCLASLFMADRR